MRPATQSRAFALLCLLGTPLLLSAQSEQVLLDAWVASSSTISDIEDVDMEFALEERVSGAYNFEAFTFLAPDVTELDPSRDLIAVSGTELIRFAGGTVESRRLDTRTAETGFRNVTAVAATSYGTVLFSGYSRRKRRFELWELLNPTAEAGVAFTVEERVPNGNPQLVDAVFIDAADVPASLTTLLGSDGGLIGVTERTVLYFPADDYAGYFALTDVRDLTVKNNTKILSADLARETSYLTLVLSDRTVLTLDLTLSSPGNEVSFAAILPPDDPDNPDAGQCADDRSQLIRIRNAGIERGSSVSVLTDNACSQILWHSIPLTDAETASTDTALAGTEGLVAVAVGEGNQTVCLPKEERTGLCVFTAGYEADLDNAEPSVILSLKVDDLCDPRVPFWDNGGALIPVALRCSSDLSASITADNGLILNDQLPENLQLALQDNGVEIIIPHYMYAATSDARFGALFVKADSVTQNLLHYATVETLDLLGFTGLGVATGLPAGTPLVADDDPFDGDDLINNDIVAYAPDNPDFPTVRGFEATSITVGEGSIYTRPRGYSAIIYGLMHDLNGASGRGVAGGITAAQFDANTGAPPVCDPLDSGAASYDPASADKTKDVYFLNLAACQFGDIKDLLVNVIPEQDAMLNYPTELQLLIDRLLNAEDKLIKTLNAAIPDAGPNAGATNFQSTLEQLDTFEELLLTTTFDKPIYKNDLLSRLEVFRFTLNERTTPWLLP